MRVGKPRSLSTEEYIEHLEREVQTWKEAFEYNALQASDNLLEITNTLERLNESEARLRLLLQHANDAIISVDDSGIVQLWNSAAERLTGYRQADIVGQAFFDYLIPPGHRETVRDSWHDWLLKWRRSPPQAASEVNLWHADGHPVITEISLSIGHSVDGLSVYAIARDVTDHRRLVDELHQAREDLESRVSKRTEELLATNASLQAEILLREKTEKHLEQMANFDSLTGLANRALLMNQLRLSLERAKRSRHRLGLLFLDLDNFKEINDSLGHAMGDKVLRRVTDILKAQVRGCDMPARLAGDEFVVLLEDISGVRDAHQLADRFHTALGNNLEIEGRKVPCSFSIGIAIHPTHGDNADDLLRHADLAMYAAKSDGKKTIRIFESSMAQSMRERIDLRTELSQALAHREFVPWYQPVVSAQSSKPIGFEVLMRWMSPERGLIPPNQFISILEESNDIVHVSDWLFEEVINRIQAWRACGAPKLQVAFNLSARQFERGYLAITMNELCNRTGLHPTNITLELTEGVLMADPEASAETLRRLSELGFMISLDDFGTGYSSLSYLKRFPIDVLKIDRSFISDILDDAKDRAMVESIIELAHKMDLHVVAEGVENNVQKKMLQEMGCEYMQGFLFSRPLPEKEFLQWIQTSLELPGSLTDAPSNDQSGQLPA